jgi:hypothetical protein
MRPSRRAAAKGQALLELTLGTLVLVTVLLFGVYFAELGFFSMKVHEAAAAAMWDSTAYRVHRINANYYSVVGAVGPSQTNTANRYQDFDGRSSVNRAGGPTLAFTRAESLTVRCQQEPLAYDVSPANPAYGPDYLQPGGVGCTAEGDTSMVNIPTSFFEGAGGFFQEAHDSPIQPTRFCSSGRTVSGNCNGRLAVLLGDYGFTNVGNEERECAVPTNGGAQGPCQNTTLYNKVRKVWNDSMIAQGAIGGYTGRGEAFVEWVTDRSAPTGRVSGFYIAYRGEESGFMQNGFQTVPHQTLPGYSTAYATRQTRGGGLNFAYLGTYSCD